MEIGSKGVCRLAIAPVRAGANDRSEMVTQLLFGDHYTITEISENKKWYKISIYFDGYEGWLDATQHTQISPEYFEQINNSDYKICTDLTSSILFKKEKINIVIGSVLPISTNELFKVEEQLAFNGESKSLSQRRDFEFIKQVAIKYLNSPYLWGGRSPFGIDCSGFTQNIFRIAGYKLPRDASQQVKKGTEVSFEDRMAGDLAFFANEEGAITHVGMLTTQENIIHASGKVRVDVFNSNGIQHKTSGILTHKLHSLRRIIKD